MTTGMTDPGNGESPQIAMPEREALAELAHEALTGADPASVFERAVGLARHALQADMVVVMEALPDGRSFVFRASAGVSGGLARGPMPPEHMPLANYALRSTGPVIIEDMEADVRFRTPPFLQRHGITSGIVVSIPVDDRQFGVIAAYTRDKRLFSHSDALYMREVANAIGASVEAQRRQRTLGVLAQSLMDAAKAPLTEAYGGVLRIAHQALDLQRTILLLYHEASAGFNLEASWPALPENVEERLRSFLLAPGELDEVARNLAEDRPADIADVEERAGWKALSAVGIKSVHVAPIISRGNARGALVACSTEPHGIGPERRSLADTLAVYAGVALENARLHDESRLRTEELETLFAISTALAQPGSFATRAERAMGILAKALDARLATLRMLSADGEALTLVAAVGPGAAAHGPDNPPPVRPANEGITGEALHLGGVVVANDYPNSPYALSHIAAIGVRSAVAAPVKADERIVGAVVLDAYAPAHFSQRRMRLLAAITNSMGTLLESARLEDEERLKTQELETLYRIGTVMSDEDSLEGKLTRALEIIALVTDAPLALVRVLDPEGRRLKLAATAGSDVDSFTMPMLLDVGDGYGGRAFQTPETIVVQDYQPSPEDEARWRWQAQGIRSAAFLPLVQEREAIGLLVVVSRERGHFTDRRMRLLSAVAESIATLVERARRQEEARLQTEELRVMFTISRLMDEPGSLREKLTRAVNELVQVSQAQSAVLQITSPDWNGLRVITALNVVTSAGAVSRVLDDSANRSIASTVIEEDGLVVANRLPLEPEALPERASHGIASALGVPVRASGRPIGALVLDAAAEGHFTERRVRLLSAVAQHLGALFENALLRDAERLRAEEAETLLNVSRTIADPGTFEQKLTRALEQLVPVSNAAVISLRLPDEHAGGLRLVARIGPPKIAASPDVIPYRTGLEAGFSTEAFERGQAVVTNGVAGNPRSRRSMVESGMRSTLSLPVRSEGRVVGLLNFASFEEDNFTDRRVQLLGGVADQLGALIEAARLQDEDHARREQMDVLLSITHLLMAEGSFEERAQRATDEIAKISSLFKVALRVPDEQAQVLRLVATSGWRAEHVGDPETIAFDQGAGGLAYRQRETVILNDYASAPQAVPELVAGGLHAGIAIPIMVGGRTVAVLSLGARDTGYFTPDRIRFYEGIAEGIGSLLEGARLQTEESARRQEAEVLLALARMLADEGTFEERAARALERIADVAGFPVMMVRLPNHDRTVLRVAAYASPGISIELKPVMELDADSLCARAFVRGEPVVSNDYQAEPSAFAAHRRAGHRFQRLSPPARRGRGARHPRRRLQGTGLLHGAPRAPVVGCRRWAAGGHGSVPAP